MLAQGGGKAPVLHTIPLNDVFTAALGAFGVVAALLHRAVTGKGQHVHVSLTKSSLAIQAVEFTRCQHFVPEVHAVVAAGADGDAPAARSSHGSTASSGSATSDRASSDDGAQSADASCSTDAAVKPVDDPTLGDDDGSDDGRAPPPAFLAGPCAAERVYRTATASSTAGGKGSPTHLFVEAHTAAQREAVLRATELTHTLDVADLGSRSPRVLALMERALATR